MKKKILIILLIVIVIALIGVGYFVFTDMGQEEKLKTEYQSFKPSSMSVFYGDSESDSEPSSLIDNLYPQNNS